MLSYKCTKSVSLPRVKCTILDLEPFGEVGANAPLHQHSSLAHSAKINNKKIIPKNQCEKHKMMFVMGPGIQKMLVRIANWEDQKQSDLGLQCLSWPFRQAGN